MFSQAEENYLKNIYSLQYEDNSSISTNLLATKMNTKPSSVTDMVKKLAVKDLVDYKKYQGVSLTEKGEKTALKVIRKHRLWEYFLVEKLHYNWEEVHDIAEQLEHIKSETLINNLESFLHFPKFDPHGDPIPDKNGRVPINNAICLLDLKVGNVGILNSVKDSSKSFLNYLNKKNIALGDRMKIIDIEDFDNSIHIETRTHRLVLSKDVAKNLYLKHFK
ncbi:MAG: metal-dependent transcriptional regulator [Flavobacteriaceae bacterium]|nr:metal-dependent transcriptional regulator [Flavobacteriaceae bacterium]